MGQDLKRDSIVLVRSIYRANKAQSKTEYLEAFLDDFEVLKLEVRLCVDLKILPIKKQDELNELYLNRVAIAGFSATGFYWSSSQDADSADSEWSQYFDDGDQHDGYYKYSTYRVRAVRAF